MFFRLVVQNNIINKIQLFQKMHFCDNHIIIWQLYILKSEWLQKPFTPCRSTQRQLTHEEKLVLTWYSGEVLCCYLPDSGHWKWVKSVHILNVNSHTNTTCKKRQKHLHCYAFFEMIPPPQNKKQKTTSKEMVNHLELQSCLPRSIILSLDFASIFLTHKIKSGIICNN